MKKSFPSVWVCMLLLFVSLFWRIVGAPVTAEHFSGLQTEVWQSGILLPQRLQRVLVRWFFYQTSMVETMEQEVLQDEMPNAEPVWVNVYLEEEDRLAKMTLNGYVCGVIAEEMPAAYHLEALKAQAVAARTRVVAQMRGNGCSRHPEAHICTNSAHCQGYASLSKCREKWKADYGVYRDRIVEAEKATHNEILMYDEKPIQVFYHAISGGKTENAQTVFAENLPYLTSVVSQGEEQVRGFRSELTISFEEMAEKLSPLVDLQLTPEQVRQSLAIHSYTATGRVGSMEVVGKEVDAVDFRQILGLRSTWFSITMNDEGVLFHQQGYGHGVGMSQAGANVMAANGSSYQQILLHYYPGVSIQMNNPF